MDAPLWTNLRLWNRTEWRTEINSSWRSVRNLSFAVGERKLTYFAKMSCTSEVTRCWSEMEAGGLKKTKRCEGNEWRWRKQGEENKVSVEWRLHSEEHLFHADRQKMGNPMYKGMEPKFMKEMVDFSVFRAHCAVRSPDLRLRFPISGLSFFVLDFFFLVQYKVKSKKIYLCTEYDVVQFLTGI